MATIEKEKNEILFRLLIQSFVTPSESDFGGYAVVMFTEEFLLTIATLRKEFLAFKEKHPQAHEWVLYTAHSEFFSSTAEIKEIRKGTREEEYVTDEGHISLGDVLTANYDPENKTGSTDYMKLDGDREILDEADRSEMDMVHIDENGVQFSCFVDEGDDFSKTVEIPYSFLFEGRL